MNLLRVALILGAGFVAAGCGDDEAVNSDEQARRAYLGLDSAVARSLTLGFAGFNAASSANIPPQTAPGAATGTLTISGQVDQGSSANKGMRLKVGATGYSDGPFTVAEEETLTVTYDTTQDVEAQPALDLSLRGIPTGTFTGTLVGDFEMSGGLQGRVSLNLNMAGALEEDGAGGVRRKANTTTVTGTAISGDGTFQVNLSI